MSKKERLEPLPAWAVERMAELSGNVGLANAARDAALVELNQAQRQAAELAGVRRQSYSTEGRGVDDHRISELLAMVGERMREQRGKVTGLENAYERIRGERDALQARVAELTAEKPAETLPTAPEAAS